MIVDGARFQYDFKAKEKQFKARIEELEKLVGYWQLCYEAAEGTRVLLLDQQDKLKDELAAVRARFRNFKAQVKAPNRLGKEQPD
jgi:hypothetical protein